MKVNFLFFLTMIFVASTSMTMAQQKQISVDVESYEQEFVGTGASCGLYIGHYLSMSEENRLKASQMLYQDIKLNYIKNYQGEYPWEKPSAYDNIVIAINNAKKFNPDLKVIICVNNLPDHLEEVKNGKPVGGEYDATIVGIMDSIANYYFHVCKGYHDRGVTVDILELVNERGYNDGKVTNLYDSAATKFKAMINDTNINTTGVPMPLIAGPATWSAASPKVFIEGWKADRSKAWANVDIVTTHGYENGAEENYQETYELSGGKPFYQSEQTGKLQNGEKPGYDVIGEQFPEASYYPVFVGGTEIARHMIDFFNGHGNAFFAFLTNTHVPEHNAGLIATKWGGSPVENPIYHGFKHLSATHPLHSNKVKHVLSDTDSLKAIAFRKKGEDTVYVHFVNLYNTYKQVSIDFKTFGIKSAQVWRTDEFLRFEEVKNETYAQSLDKIAINITPYGVVTVKVVIDGAGSSASLKTQSIAFNKINDLSELGPGIVLSATASSGLPVEFEVVKGPATISGNSLKVTGVGPVIVIAKQAGDATYFEAEPVAQYFFIRPAGENVALNKPATASSEYSSTYPASKAVDGDLTSENSRWLTKSGATFPQWIEIDLQGEQEVKALALYSGNGGHNIPIWEFNFQVWANNGWTTVITETDNVVAEYLKEFSPVTTSKVRLYMENAPSKYIARLYEIEVYGTYKEIPTGIFNEGKVLNVLNTYPNPVENRLYITNTYKNANVKIVSIAGNLVMDTHYKNGVDVSHLPKGMYILSVDGKNQSKFIKK